MVVTVMLPERILRTPSILSPCFFEAVTESEPSPVMMRSDSAVMTPFFALSAVSESFDMPLRFRKHFPSPLRIRAGVSSAFIVTSESVTI